MPISFPQIGRAPSSDLGGDLWFLACLSGSWCTSTQPNRFSIFMDLAEIQKNNVSSWI